MKIKKPITLRIFGLPDKAKICCPIIDGSRCMTMHRVGLEHKFITDKGLEVTLSPFQPLVKNEDHYELQ